MKIYKKALHDYGLLFSNFNTVKIAQKSQFDIYGSYTGVDAFDKYDKPVQDADDL